MFVHWGLYSQLGRGEWAMHQEGIPAREYEHLADRWQPERGAPRQWARLARDAGMRYMVLTTKHHEGFCLWDTQQMGYNAVARGPKRDLVREYVDACREYGLKVGLYYSLMDWHHPDGWRCAEDEEARRRFVAFTHGCVRELMSNYGKIDLLWYDIPEPLKSAEAWESPKMNAMVRELQPGIVINDRSRMAGDFASPEGEIKPADRPWEACMTCNGDWGYTDVPEDDWLSVRDVLKMLRKCAAYGGNLLLNNGPLGSGRTPRELEERLTRVGQWMAKHGEAVNAPMDRIDGRLMEWGNVGFWTMRGNVGYHWLARTWPGESFSIGGVQARALSAELLGSGRPLGIEQQGTRLVLRGLPVNNPEPIAGVAVIKTTFAEPPRQNRPVG